MFMGIAKGYPPTLDDMSAPVHRHRPQALLTFHQGGQQRHISCLPTASWQVEPDLLQSFPQTPAPILGLGP